MSRGRLEAFTDGVIAILVTIMVLDLRPPAGHGFSDLRPLVPKLLVYLLSFVVLAIYWNNHHHLFHAVHHVTGGTLWANMHLLFWLSLVPFCTGWMDDNHYAPVTVAAYGVVLLCAGIAYYMLTRVLLAHHEPDSLLHKALGSDFKGKISIVLYAIAIPLAFFLTWAALAIYALVALVWLVPDTRFERVLAEHNS